MVFGSLYNCEITLNPLQIVSTLATATMFQLDGLIEKCTEVMLETINPKVCTICNIEFFNNMLFLDITGLLQCCLSVWG